MTLDLDRIHSIEQVYGSLDPLEAYYRKGTLTYETHSPIVPKTRRLLEQALHGMGGVLDVGCGDGQTLMACAGLFQRGTGLDESEYAICAAHEQAKRRHIRNLDFVLGKAVGLPFEAERFDFIFSERGPLGHADVTLIEALRVLKPGGRIFIETGGWTGPGRTLLTSLDEERERFERMGVRIEILATRVEQHKFQNIYAWFEMQCTVWRYFENNPPFPYTQETLNQVAAKAGGPDRQVMADYQTIWIGGQKPTCAPTA